MNVYEKEGKEITLDSGLNIIVHEEGSGETPKQHDLVEVHYTGFLNDGTQFDSSLDRGTPFKFTLGQGKVIPGWDEGFSKLNVGTKATLVIPPKMGYGEKGAGAKIPPNSTLFFQVELLAIHPIRNTSTVS